MQENYQDQDDDGPVIRSALRECFTINFNTLENQIQKPITQKRLPRWKYIDKGLNLRGVCRNQNCRAYKQFVMVQQKFGDFFINQIAFESLCIECKEPLEDIDNIYLFQCQWLVEGKIDGQKQKIIKSGIADDPVNYTTFKEGDNVTWNYLKIKVNKLK